MREKTTLLREKATDWEVQQTYERKPDRLLKIFSDRYAAIVVATAAAILKDRRDAEEVSSDTFLALSKQLPQERIHDVGAWLRKVVKNKSISQLRKNARRKEICQELIENEENPIQTVHSDTVKWTERELEGCMQLFFEELHAKYSDEEQILVLGRLFHNQAYEVLAEEINWDLEKAKRRYATIIRAIKKKIKQRYQAVYLSLP